MSYVEEHPVEAALAGLASSPEAATIQHDDLVQQLAAVTADLIAAQTEIATITAERDNYKMAAAQAAAKPKATVSKSGTQRTIAPPKGETVSFAPAELLELIKGADKVELAFSDGKREIAGLPAMTIEGAAWAVTPAGLALRGVPLSLHGPAHGQGAFPLAGYGLLLDGELVTYVTRPETLQIGANQEYDLSGDVVF